MAPAEAFQNLLLRRLTEADLRLLGPLKHVELKLRKTVEAPNVANQSVYFFESGLASVVGEVASPGASEIAMIGREGVTGVGELLGDQQTPFRTFMQADGTAYQCEMGNFRDAIDASRSLRTLLQAYARAFTFLVASTAISNGRAKLEERLARWLLMVADRLGSEFFITHASMALTLAVRRPGVTLAVQSLEGRGLIKAGRGHIRILDREGLIKTAKGGYGLAEREYERLLRNTSPFTKGTNASPAGIGSDGLLRP